MNCIAVEWGHLHHLDDVAEAVVGDQLLRGQRHRARLDGVHLPGPRLQAPRISLIFDPYVAIDGHRRLNVKEFAHIPYVFILDYQFM